MNKNSGIIWCVAIRIWLHTFHCSYCQSAFPDKWSLNAHFYHCYTLSPVSGDVDLDSTDFQLHWLPTKIITTKTISVSSFGIPDSLVDNKHPWLFISKFLGWKYKTSRSDAMLLSFILPKVELRQKYLDLAFFNIFCSFTQTLERECKQNTYASSVNESSKDIVLKR